MTSFIYFNLSQQICQYTHIIMKTSIPKSAFAEILSSSLISSLTYIRFPSTKTNSGILKIIAQSYNLCTDFSRRMARSNPPKLGRTKVRGQKPRTQNRVQRFKLLTSLEHNAPQMSYRPMIYVFSRSIFILLPFLPTSDNTPGGAMARGPQKAKPRCAQNTVPGRAIWRQTK